MFELKLTRRRFLGISIPIVSILCSSKNKLLSGEFEWPKVVPDRIFFGGNVITVDGAFRIASAFAVAGERLLAVGNDADVLKRAGSETRRIDLQGKTVLPGLIDSHAHPAAAALYELDHEIPSMDTIEDVLDYFRVRTKVVPEGDWIGVQQVFVTRLRERRFPTRAELDAVGTKHPIYFRTGPDMMLNSLALKKFGIAKDSGDHPELQCGLIERDGSGEPVGMLRNSMALRQRIVPDASKAPGEKRLAALKRLLSQYNSVGITSTTDRTSNDHYLSLYQALKDSGDLTCRVYAFYGIDGKFTPDEIESAVAAIARSPLTQNDPLFRVGGVKMYLDGGMLTGSARMRKPWGISDIYNIADPDYRGLLFLSEEQLTRFAEAAARYRLQPTLHCVGDGALEFLVDAYLNVVRKGGANGNLRELRPGICHGNFLFPEVLPKIRETGAVIDMQPDWLYLDGVVLTDHFKKERLAWFQPYRTLLDEKIPIAGGSDHMLKIAPNRAINSYDPFRGIWTTLTRRPRWSDEALYPDQRITRKEAIRFYTIDSAYAIRSETEKGSLEAGKLADFIVLDRDILTCPVDDILETRVLETWLGGRKVYDVEAKG